MTDSTITLSTSAHSPPDDLWRIALRRQYFETFNGNAYYSHIGGGEMDCVAAIETLRKLATQIGAQVVSLYEGEITGGSFGFVTGASCPADAFVGITSGALEVESPNDEQGRMLWDALSKHLKPAAKDTKYLHCIVQKRKELSLQRSAVEWADIVPESYPSLWYSPTEGRDMPTPFGADTLFDALVSMCVDADPVGRMSILHGPPGTGKTHLLRGLVARLGHKAKFVVVSPDIAAGATGPDMLTLLMDNEEAYDPDDPDDPDEYQPNPDPGRKKPYVLIIEDADALLKQRATSDRKGFAGLSALLNASDGIIGALCDVRIICTMNTDHPQKNDIDVAALREGRCAVNAFLGPLDALTAWEHIVDRTGISAHELTVKHGVSVSGQKTLAEVYGIVKRIKAKLKKGTPRKGKSK